MEKKKQPKKARKPKLTRKRKGFVKAVAMGETLTDAALKNFDTKDRKVAASIGAELMEKPEIVEAVIVAEKQFKDILDEHMPEVSVVKAHVAQMNANRMDHMTFPLGPEDEDDINFSGAVVTKHTEIDQEEIGDEDENADRLPEPYKERTTLTDKEIIEMLAEVNCKVRRIVHGETARHVYFWSPDNMARDKAIDKAYKIRGRYGDEANPVRTPSTVTYNFLFSAETQESIKLINQKIKDKLIHAQ